MATDPRFYVDELYPLQDRVLAAFAAADTGFYLSGGTAASRGYVEHRFSDDLDLFVNDAPEFGLWSARLIRSLNDAPDLSVTIGLREERFHRLTAACDGVSLKIQLINDIPAHIGQVRSVPRPGKLDSAENILANKVTALIDRDEPKDLADIWGFCCTLGLSLERALADAHGKVAGIFPVDLARRLIETTTDDWRLIRWIHTPPAEQFVAELHALGESLLLGTPAT